MTSDPPRARLVSICIGPAESYSLFHLQSRSKNLLFPKVCLPPSSPTRNDEKEENRSRWSLTSCSTTRERAYIFHSINRLYTFRTVLAFCLELYFFSWSCCSSAAVVLQTEDTPPAILLDVVWPSSDLFVFRSHSRSVCEISRNILFFFLQKAMNLTFRRWCWNSFCESSPRRIVQKNK